MWLLRPSLSRLRLETKRDPEVRSELLSALGPQNSFARPPAALLPRVLPLPGSAQHKGS